MNANPWETRGNPANSKRDREGRSEREVRYSIDRYVLTFHLKTITFARYCNCHMVL